MRQNNHNKIGKIIIKSLVIEMFIVFNNPSFGQKKTLLPTIGCDGVIQGCWVIDVPETETTPADCMLEFLSLAKTEVNACKFPDKSTEEKISADISYIENFIIKNNPNKTKNEIDESISKRLNTFKKYIEENNDVCSSKDFRNVLEKITAIQNKGIVDKIIKLNNNNTTCK